MAGEEVMSIDSASTGSFKTTYIDSSNFAHDSTRFIFFCFHITKKTQYNYCTPFTVLPIKNPTQLPARNISIVFLTIISFPILQT